jgi:hypothetical protein
MLGDRLTEMVASFNTNLRPHYEAQANAIQVDIGLILRADPYKNKPLEDDPDEISNLIQNAVAGSAAAAGKPIPDPIAEGDFVSDAGKFYTEFVHEVNNAMEERDINLTLLQVCRLPMCSYSRASANGKAAIRTNTTLAPPKWSSDTSFTREWLTKSTNSFLRPSANDYFDTLARRRTSL